MDEEIVMERDVADVGPNESVLVRVGEDAPLEREVVRTRGDVDIAISRAAEGAMIEHDVMGSASVDPNVVRGTVTEPDVANDDVMRIGGRQSHQIAGHSGRGRDRDPGRGRGRSVDRQVMRRNLQRGLELDGAAHREGDEPIALRNRVSQSPGA